MPAPTVTAQDLQDWSPRLDARAHLPTLVRRLIFATVRPDQIVVPDAEGIGLPGLDGILLCPSGAPPYVPSGRSAWEFKTSGDPQKELGKDYRKRTKSTTDSERARTTIVLVTTRIWEQGKVDAWIARRAKDGWAGIEVLTAEDLATWLSQCPGVLSWLEEHCGRNPYGRTALRDWWENWSNATEPAVPPALLLAGRSAARDGILLDLSRAASSHVIAAGTEEEAIAFLAGALLVTRPLEATDDAQEPSEEETATHAAEEASWREAILERTIVVHDTNAWRSLVPHHEALVLVPTATCDPSIDAAIKSGHHVLVPQTARPGEPSLPRLSRTEAREAWETAGVPWSECDELARAARRSLTSLRRRRGRAGHLRRPDWASGTSSQLLASLLLAGSWNSALTGDERTVLQLSGQSSIRDLDRELTVLASESDSPIRQRKRGWHFVDPIDAWDQLGPVVSQHELDLFRERAIEVLSYRNPTLDLATAERLAADLRGELPSPEYSQSLREGIAETLAILGAVREETALPGEWTGASLAARIVHDLLHDASPERWRCVVDLLPELAEAAPSVFLNAVEESLRRLDPPILTLFDEHRDEVGLFHRSAHTHLLWALEHLAFSPTHLSRVVVILGLLTQRDPGGKLQNRPANSLRDALHIVNPQSSASPTSRLGAIDALRASAPRASWHLLLGLIQAVDRGMLISRGPRHRDWPRAEPPSHRDVLDAATEIGDRIVEDIVSDDEKWIEAIDLVTKLPASVRSRMLTEADTIWNQLHDDTQRTVVAKLRDQVSRHTKYRDSAWALDEEELAELDTFVQAHTSEADATGAHILFSYWPEIDGVDFDTEDGQAELRNIREDAIRDSLPDGLEALAAASDLPALVGSALAAVTTDLDDKVVGWLASEEVHLQSLASGLARFRHQRDSEWLWGAIETHNALRIELLLTRDVDDALIAHVDTMNEHDQADYWSRIGQWAVPDELRVTVARKLAAQDRPFSAMDLLSRDDGGSFPIELGLEVMAKPLTGTNESVEVLHSPAYVMGGMLDRLAAAGAPTQELGLLEWWYNPALRHQRTPEAFNTMLAEDPELFAHLVALTSYADDSDEVSGGDTGEVVGDDDNPPTDHDDSSSQRGGGEGEEPHDRRVRFPDSPENRQNAFEILREWRLPLPGAKGTDPPESAALQDWVDRARAELEALKRTRAGVHQIGEALSGPAVDTDGTWPCRAVRDMIENENDPEIENGLRIGRINSRGVTMRAAYSGGQQERDLAEKYKRWADQVRNNWPRTGALLDSIAEGYAAEARREDKAADELGDR